ncbi:MAG: site-specific integrase [Alphaproteobacteria bacterium]|nr:site-specific integrase [Alphaproteobacteria bacterium]
MARTVKDARIESREARGRLPARHEPHWRAIDSGAHLGYRKGPRGGSWIARARVGGAYAKSVLGTADDVQDADGVKVLNFRQAQEHARAWFTVKARAEAGLGARDGYSVKDAVDAHLADLGARGKPSGIRFATVTANSQIIPALGAIEVAKLSTAQVRDWHQAIALAPARVRSRPGAAVKHRATPATADAKRARKATANRILTILKAALNHAHHDGNVTDDRAWRRVKPFRGVETVRVRYLNADEARRLVNACPSDFRKLVQGALLTGCRYGELIAMRVRDFNTDARTVHVADSKSGKPRDVPLADDGATFFTGLVAWRKPDALMFLRLALKRESKMTWRELEPWRQFHQLRRFAAAAKAAKVDGVSFHSLRHSYGSALAMAGVPMRVIAEALGHADTRVTEKHYSALSPSYVADTIRVRLIEPSPFSSAGDGKAVELSLGDSAKEIVDLERISLERSESGRLRCRVMRGRYLAEFDEAPGRRILEMRQGAEPAPTTRS